MKAFLSQTLGSIKLSNVLEAVFQVSLLLIFIVAAMMIGVMPLLQELPAIFVLVIVAEACFLRYRGFKLGTKGGQKFYPALFRAAGHILFISVVTPVLSFTIFGMALATAVTLNLGGFAIALANFIVAAGLFAFDW